MEIAAIIFSLLLIAFFSGIEIAFVSANKLRIELLKEKGSARARIVSEFTANPSKFISTMLIGLNISLVLFGTVTAHYLVHSNFPFLPGNDLGVPLRNDQEIPLLLIQTLITAFIILIF